MRITSGWAEFAVPVLAVEVLLVAIGVDSRRK